tara:strand:+ start:6172 stop:8013 length:1842 start_codon:yes stop_codon:yes gene_type:complete
MVDTPRIRKRVITPNDWKNVAETIIEEFRRRKGARADLELRWAEVDRQVAMHPDTESEHAWIPNLELPLQAETLEVLNADARRLLFPPDRSFFSAHTSMTEQDQTNLNFQSYIENINSDPVARHIDQKGPQVFGNMLARAVLEDYHTQYDFRGVWDLINAENFKYGTTAPKMRAATRDMFTNEFRGVIRDTERLPALTPVSIKETYLDDAPSRLTGEGFMIQPTHLRSYLIDLNDLALAAKKGSKDPTKENGGWMPAKLKNIEPLPDPRNHVRVIEQDGDLMVTRSTGPSIFIPNVIVSVVLGGGNGTVFRFREKEFGFRSQIPSYYHRDDVDVPYGVSPLIKGAPIHRSATVALNLLMATAHLQVMPPVRYERDDYLLQAAGGPVIEPGAMWDSISKIEAIKIGDINGMLAAYQLLLAQYAEVTGITAPRLGQQTKSHQTAFAIDTEQTRGVVRTVDYVRNLANGPMQTVLHMEYEMAKKLLKNKQIFIPELGAYVEVSGSQLPKHVTFEVHGAGGTIEEREKEQKFLNAIRAFASLEPLVRQLKAQGADVTLGDIDEVRRALLRIGDINDTEAFFAEQSAGLPPGTEQPDLLAGGSGGVSQDPFAAVEQIA